MIDGNRKFEIQEIDPQTLIAWDKNPRNHNIPALKASIERFGFRNIVVVNKRTNVIEAGHGRVQAAVELGIPVVPVLFVEDDDTTASAYTIADNRQSDLGGWDEASLLPLLQELQAMNEDVSMEGVGFSDADIADLMRRVTPSESTASGLSVAEKLAIYNEGTVRQIILYYSPEEYEDLLVRMKAIMGSMGIESNSALLVELVTAYESRA